MPRQNALSFFVYEGIQHFREHGSPGFFGSFCLLEGGDDFQSFFCGKFTKLSDLSFDGKSLSLFTLRGLPSVEDVLHAVMVAKKFAVGACKGNALRWEPRRGWAALANRAQFSIWSALYEKIRTELRGCG
ncbi:MAG: hypothetical protein V1926_04930 [Candidatus Peregrinibacteria bacterium]